jgi:hypothetical protein
MGKTGKGDCYYVGGTAVINEHIDDREYIGELHLVHAEVQGQGDISHIRYGHAWIEDDVNVYDFSNNRELIIPKIVYYAIGDVKTDNPLKYQRYTFNEARRKMVESGHYGCWDLDVEYNDGGFIKFKTDMGDTTISLDCSKPLTNFQRYFVAKLDAIKDDCILLGGFWYDNNPTNFGWNKEGEAVLFDIEDWYNQIDRKEFLEERYPTPTPLDVEPFLDDNYELIAIGEASMGGVYLDKRDGSVLKLTASPSEVIGSTRIWDAQKKDESYTENFVEIYDIQNIGKGAFKGTWFDETYKDGRIWDYDWYIIKRAYIEPFDKLIQKEADCVVEIIKRYYGGMSAKVFGTENMYEPIQEFEYQLRTNRVTEYAKGGTITWKDKYNRKYGFKKGTSHSLKDIAKKTKKSIKGLQQIYNKGIGAWKTNIGSVRLKKDFSKNANTKKYPRSSRLGKEQWAMARVYSAVMGGKASKVDAKELKMETGGNILKQPRDLSKIPNFHNIYKGAEHYGYSDNDEKVEQSDRWFTLFIQNQKEKQLSLEEFKEFMELSNILSWEDLGDEPTESYARGGRTKPNKIVKNLQEEVDRVKNEIIDNADISDENKEKLKKIPAYVVNQHRGVASYSRGFFSIPLWAYDRQHLDFKDFKIKYSTWRKDWFEKNKVHEGYFIYYVAHELAHWLCHINQDDTRCVGHNPQFYKAFKKLCPYRYQHYELAYIKTSSKQGIPTYEQCKLTPAEEQTPKTEHCGTEEVKSDTKNDSTSFEKHLKSIIQSKDSNRWQKREANKKLVEVLSKKQKDMNEFKTLELQKRSFDEIPKVRSEMSLKDIIDGLKSVSYLYESDKKTPVRDLLADYVAKGFYAINDSKVFVNKNDNSKHEKRIREELFPLVTSANGQLPTTAKFPIGSVDFGGTDFLRFLPKSYIDYLDPKDIKGIRVKQILKPPYPISPINEDLQKVFQSWLGNDFDIRPVMSGINFDEYGATGTDAHKLLHLVGKKEGQWSEGTYYTNKTLQKWYKDLEKEVGDIGSFDSYAQKSRKIDEKYPNYQAVLDFNNYLKYGSINCQLIADAINIITKNRLTNLVTRQIRLNFKEHSTKDIVNNEGGERSFCANAFFLLQNFKTWIQLGVDSVDIYLLKDDIAYHSKAIVFLPKGTDVGWGQIQNHSYSLVMPVMCNYTSPTENTYIDYINENEVDLVVDNSPPYKMESINTSKQTKKFLKMKDDISKLKSTLPFILEDKVDKMQQIIERMESTLPHL